MSTPHDSPLGKTVSHVDEYAPHLLFPIPRAPKRAELGLGASLPFTGFDLWNAYELSWLGARGKPQVALATFRVPADSPAIVESKSFKLYLNSYNQTRLPDAAELRRRLIADLSAATGAPVTVELVEAGTFDAQALAPLAGDCIDALDVAIDDYGPPRPDLLACLGDAVVEECLVSHLLKSNCPVTGQPDWASVQVRYRGPRIDPVGLLRYLVSFRRHDDFHEQCVERIFVDLTRRCAPQRLAVYARYTRRGGLDINPWRATPGEPEPGNPRGARQ